MSRGQAQSATRLQGPLSSSRARLLLPACPCLCSAPLLSDTLSIAPLRPAAAGRCVPLGRLGQSRQLRAGSGGRRVTRWTDRRAADRLDRTTRAASPRPHPNGTRRVTSDMTGSEPGRRRSVGTYRRNRPLNGRGRDGRARVTATIRSLRLGPFMVISCISEGCCRHDAAIQYKPQRCRRQLLEHVPILDSVP